MMLSRRRMEVYGAMNARWLLDFSIVSGFNICEKRYACGTVSKRKH